MTRETSSQINEAAAAWAARLDRGDLNAAERQALDDWTVGDSRRLGALARALALLAPVEKSRGVTAATPRRRGGR